MFKKVYIMYCPVCGYVDGEHMLGFTPGQFHLHAYNRLYR